MFGGNGISLADIAAVTGNNGNGDGFGGNNGWWVIIILLALFGRNGWGNGDQNGQGNGSNGGCGTQAVEAAVQRGFDTQGITNKLNGLENGICSLGYDQLAQMNNLGTNILQTGYATQTQLQNCCCNIENAVQANTVANMQNNNALQALIQQCCCNLEAQFAQANYNRATDTCAITTAIANASQAQMQNCNANFRALHDELVDLQMQNKDAQIAALTQKLTMCDTQNMISTGNAQVIAALQQKAAVPAYLVCNPNTGYYYPQQANQGCCNQNTCCGNGWNGQF